ncbi:MAG: hypothetical protein SCH71_14440 [Desulfobulbaceae bacterium]|nr:hypothetical protein [Desulfobulbaceae bacterium]
MKKTFFLLLGVCLVLVCASSAVAAVSLKRLAEHPFSPPMSSEADLRAMVERNRADLQTGFDKAGHPRLYQDLMAQFPDADIETIRVDPGEQFFWMLFRNKNTGQIKALNDVTWEGDSAFDAFRFYIDSTGQRNEFIVPAVCGNISLRKVGPIPAAAVVPPPPAVTPEPVREVPGPEPVVSRAGGPLFDIGLAHQFDPATYVFARVGYEIPFAEKFSAMGLVGGFIRFDGDDGGDAFTIDALLNYYFTEKMFAGGGVGFWSDEEEVDLIVNLGYLIYERPGTFRTSLFIEGRTVIDDLISSEGTRLGAGLRFQF